MLLVVAAPAEARAVRAGLVGGLGLPQKQPLAHPSPNWYWPLSALGADIDLLETGVGKANAAAAVAKRLDPSRHALVLNLGIAGSLPGPDRPSLGDSILATTSLYADEGVLTPAGFQSIVEMGFPPGPLAGLAVPGTPDLLTALRPLAARAGPIATVSTCSGTDALAHEVARRTGAIAEGMEGAAIAHTLARLSPTIAFAEFRVISNTTGDRSEQQWDIRAAFDRLSALVALLI